MQETSKIKAIWTNIKYFIYCYIIAFYVLPLLTFIPTFFFSVQLWNIMALIILPVIVIIGGVVVGFKYGIKYFYPVFIGAIFFPSSFIYGFLPAWQYVLWFAIIALISNVATHFLMTTKKKTKIKK